ncbi:MAG: carboxylating nicotinate-nucleotide diphosphorylase [Deltaproteobacteria bacterium]|nr:carboxylating nicotinate-nucleotide diphosphorylase [Deltaproteobacteria bacterium]
MRTAVRRALEEDIAHGDVTTEATVPVGTMGGASLVARVPMVVCGLPVLREVYAQVDPAVQIVASLDEGASSGGGAEVVARIEGPLRSILTGERVSLNFLQRMSGIATRTAMFTRLLGERSTRLVDTRKTTPGIRALERYAVRVGGGRNHRFNLADGILIKDNHIAAAGGVTAAVSAALATAHHLLQVEVEVESMAEAHEAVDAGARVIMLDNFSVDELRAAVVELRSRPEELVIEASGNVSEHTVVAIADCGVDVISSGGLIHQAVWLDIALEFDVG